MKKWVWTFGSATPHKGKYVVVNTADDDGREYMYGKYGQRNCAMSYPYDMGMAVVNKYGYQLKEEVTV